MPRNRTTASGIDRRRFLQGTLAAAGIPPLCCVSAVAPSAAVSFSSGRLRLDLSRVPALRKRASSVAVVAAAPQVNLLVIHARNGAWVALDRACTHGGAMCTYNQKRQSVQCTSLNHAEYDLRGTLLHGRTHGNLRAYPVAASRHAVEIDLGTMA